MLLLQVLSELKVTCINNYSKMSTVDLISFRVNCQNRCSVQDVHKHSFVDNPTDIKSSFSEILISFSFKAGFPGIPTRYILYFIILYFMTNVFENCNIQYYSVNSVFTVNKIENRRIHLI